MTKKIDTVSARLRLTIRREPFWHRVSKGCYVGFRKMTTGSTGSWSARAFDESTGKQVYKAIGDLGELPDHQRFDAAQKTAQMWFDHLGRGGNSASTTIHEVCDRYVAHLRAISTAKAAEDADARFARYVINNKKLAATDVSKLTPLQVEAWRKNLKETPALSGPNRGKRRSDSTLNRDMTCFRAALNLAYSEGLISSDFAWRSKLVPVKNADQHRDLYLDRNQRRKFIEMSSPDLSVFLRGLTLLPLRPGAMAALTVGHYDERLKVLKIGIDKNGKDRKIVLPPATAEIFNEASKDKLPGAPLLARENGEMWTKDAWKWPVKAAAVAAELPIGSTAYTLRHSVITDLVHDGLDLLTVAQISGTSVAMIEKHYGHLRSEVAAGALARLAL